MMNCKEATALMSKQMDHPLILTERISLKFHLMMCSGCHNFNQHMHDLRDITQTYAKGKDQPEAKEIQRDPD